MLERTEVVVVGAGLAGLAAARALGEAGVPFVVLEARDRVGGRTHTVVEEPGVAIDHGGQWVGPTQDRVLDWIERLGLETFETYGEGDNLQLRSGELTRYSGAIPLADPVVAADLMDAMVALTVAAADVDPAAPWDHPAAALLDSTTVESWLAAQSWDEAAKDWLRLACRAVFPAEPGEISLLHALFYLRSGGSLERLLGTVNAAQERRIVGGAQGISLAMAEPVLDRIRFTRPVTRIEHDTDGVTAYAGDLAVRADRAIVTLPPALAARISYAPPMPGMRDQLTQRSWMGAVIKVHVVYAEPFWRSDRLSGQAIGDVGPVRLTFDNSPPDGDVGVLVGFLEADDARRWNGRTVQDRRAAVLECLVRFFGERAATPLRYHERSWLDEEFSRGGYVGIMAPGTWHVYGPALREPVGPIHWAGTETASVWNGYMDGAIRSGEAAAAAVLAEPAEEGRS